MIRPIIEYYPIEYKDSQRCKRYEVLDTENPRQGELAKLLKDNVGVYILYDSLYKAIYVGKTTRNLLIEIKEALNRSTGASHSIWVVDHPTRQQAFIPDRESKRKIKKSTFLLSHSAYYFSAYAVDRAILNNVEALLIRAFANHLVNFRRESFQFSD